MSTKYIIVTSDGQPFEDCSGTTGEYLFQFDYFIIIIQSDIQLKCNCGFKIILLICTFLKVTQL